MNDIPCRLEFTALVEAQCAAFSRRQARAAGFTDRMIRWRVATGAWVQRHPDVFAPAGTPESGRHRLWAAVLATAPSGVVSVRAAAALWGFEVPEPGLVEVTVPYALPRKLVGVVVHRARSLDPCDVADMDGLPVTRPARTLLDLARQLDALELEVALDSALRRGRITPGILLRTLDRLAADCHRGGPLLRDLAIDRLREGPTGSTKETVLRARLLEAGAPRPVRQHRVLGSDGRTVARFDLAWPDALVAVEFDSWTFHSSRDDWRRDQVRGNDAAASGWLVLRATEAALVDEAMLARLVAQIVDALQVRV